MASTVPSSNPSQQSSAAQSVTIQLGPSSNYVCSHLWNRRSKRTDGNYSYCFRQSEVDLTWSPRTVIVDFKDNLYETLGTKRAKQGRDILSDVRSVWGGPVSQIQQDIEETPRAPEK
jgi:hypothetical protein